jgi:hypothetical protein
LSEIGISDMSMLVFSDILAKINMDMSEMLIFDMSENHDISGMSETNF